MSRVLKSIDERKNVSKEKTNEYVDKLIKMINCKTVFVRDGSNDKEFAKFYRVIEENFPLLHKRAKKLVFGSGCFVYVLKGKRATRNVMLMSHHDVVDETDGWHSDAFKAKVKDGSIYGRGTIDTKTPLFAQMQACEELLEEGWPFDDINVYIGSSNNEEVCGDGMVIATKYFKDNNIFFDIVLDEGGAITTGMIPGFAGKSAMVAVHEKSRHMYKCVAKALNKGHGGLNPNNDNVIVRLNSFIAEVNKSKVFGSKFYPEVAQTFKCHAPYAKFPMNMVFGNLELFSPIVKKIMLNIPVASAMLSTSVTFTSYFAGSVNDPQIKAKEAYTTMFVRCIREDDMNVGMEKIKAIGEKYGVEITQIEKDYCKPSSFESAEYKLVKDVLNENFPDVVVAPFLLTAGTDARRFSDVAKSILRFAPIDLDSKQYASIHGDDEHIKIDNIGQCVCFYKDVLLKYEGEK